MNVPLFYEEVRTMMKHGVILFFCVLVLLPCRVSVAMLVTFSEKDIADAITQGREQGAHVIEYINRHYRFGDENGLKENGIIRTKWSKLMVFSGLVSDKGMKPTEQQQDMILSRTELQIDVHTIGDKMDFANDYRVHLVQKGVSIEPEKISADDVAYFPKKGGMTSGFPRYHATIRAYFAYDKITPDDKADIILLKDKKRVVFEVNFADYK
jgi:hypothetical protein